MPDCPESTPWLLRFVPARTRAQLLERHELRNALANVGWLSTQTALQAVLGLLVGAWVARTLGPANYGILSYALAFVALLSPLANMGVNVTVVRDIVRTPKDAYLILGTATFLRGLGSLALILVAMVAIVLLRPREWGTWLLVGLVALGYGIRNLGTADLWFSAKVQGKYTALSRAVAMLTAAALKVALVLAGAALPAFFVVYSVELALITFTLFLVYTRTSELRLTAWRVNLRRARHMFSESWPLVFAGIASFIYMRIDEVLLGELRDDAAVGVYAVGARLSETFQLLPSFVLASVFPSLIKVRDSNPELYLSRIQRIYDVFVWFALLSGILMQLLAEPIIELLVGKAFADAAPVLALHIWSGVFWFSGSAGHRHLISEHHTRIALFMTVSGAIVNVLMNLWLIPPLGPLGAACGTIISFAVSHCLSAAVFAPSRITLLFFARALYLPGVVRRMATLLAG